MEKTLNEKYQQIYELLYELLNFTSSSLHRDGSHIHMAFDGFGEFTVSIEPDSIELYEDD